VHRPETLLATLAASNRLCAWLAALPPLDPRGPRPCQAEAIGGVYAELAAREKLDLNLPWLREDGATDPATLPPPGEIAATVAEELEAALARFRAVAARLG
jgi:hypothetical protein